nr:hypothetical protein MACL_00003339 [Theileria orientalis]
MAGRDRNFRLFVGNLPYDTTEEDLRAMLHGCGTIRYLAIRRDYHTNKSRGYGNVEYRTEAECVEAIKRLGAMEVKVRTNGFAGRPVKVDFCDDFYRDKYSDILLDTLYHKESSQPKETDQAHTQEMDPGPYNMQVQQPGMQQIGHPDMSPYGHQTMGPMDQSGYGMVQPSFTMAQQNMMPMPQGSMPMVQPNIPMVQGDMAMYPQANMGLMQPAVGLMQPTLAQQGLVRPGLVPSGLIQQGMAQATMAPMMQIPAEISQLDPMEAVQPVSVTMDPALSQPMGTHTGHHHYQNQTMQQAMSGPMTQHMNSPINNMGMPLNQQLGHQLGQPLNQQLNQPLTQSLAQPLTHQINSPTSQQVTMAGSQQYVTQVKHHPGKTKEGLVASKALSGRNGQMKDLGDYAKHEHKRYRAEEELLLDNGKVVSKDLLRIIKKMSMMDVYNLVKRIDALMKKSPNTARSILNASSSMRASLMHAKLLLGYKNLNFSHLSKANASNIFEYFFIR